MYSILQLWNAWLAYTWNYYDGGYSLYTSYIPAIMAICVIIGLIAGAVEESGNDSAYLEVLASSLSSGFYCFFIGALLSLFFMVALPILVLVVPIIIFIATYIALGRLNLTYIIPKIGQKMSRLTQAGKHLKYWLTRRLLKSRRTPQDYLRELDEDAKATETKLAELVAHQKTLEGHASIISGRLSEAKKHKEAAGADDVSYQIATSVLSTFVRQKDEVDSCLSEVKITIDSVMEGKKKMGNLLSLARLCHQAGEPLSTNTREAIEAAHVALASLIESFAKADTALSVAALNVPEIDAELVTRPLCDMTKMTRSISLRDTAESLAPGSNTRLRLKC